MLARRRSSRTLYVLLQDNTTATLPEWMFDAAYCKTVVCQEMPLLSLSALHDLRRLIDVASVPCANNSTKQTILNRPGHQTELPLPSERANHPLPEQVVAEGRQLIAQLLRAVLLAEKEAEHEH